MTCINGLTIGLIVFTVDWVHHPTISAAPVAITPYPLHGPWRTPNGVADTKEELSEYLTRFGHLRQRRLNGNIDKEFRSAIRSLQKYAGINRTGEIDDATRAVMHKPRCGLPDPPSSSRKRRYTLAGSKWTKTSFYYRFHSFTAKLKPNELMAVFASAFKLWSSVVALTFTQTYSPSLTDFEILFASGDHGDGFPFDGIGGILAHTFGPTDGRMHFDENEDWNKGFSSGIDLRQVAAHEIGHVIGLGHSSVTGSLMNPFYPGFNENIRLTNDDIEAIQSLYGIPDNYKPSNEDNPPSSSSSSSSTTSTTTTTTPTPTTTITSSITLPTTTESTTTTSSLSSSTVVQKLLMTRFTPVPQTKRITPLKSTRS